MTLKERINKDYLIAFKAKDILAKNILSVVKGEIQTQEKNTNSENLSDENVLKILTKTSKSLKETISLSDDDTSKAELLVIEKYLPKLMTREEIVIKVGEVVNSGVREIGNIMKSFDGMPVDKKVVSEVIREILN